MKIKFRTYFLRRNKLSLRDIRSGRELWRVMISRWQIYLGVLLVFGAMVAGALALVLYTPVFDLAPAHPGASSRALLLDNIKKLDSMERELSKWNTYYNDMLLVLDGGVPSSSIDSLKEVTEAGEFVGRSTLDSLLRDQYQNDTLNTLESLRLQNQVTFKFTPPSLGLIVKAFDPRDKHFGVSISPPAGGAVLASMDGVVISNQWYLESGYTIVVQHSGDMITIVRGVDRLLTSVGSRVKGGQVIGECGAAQDGTSVLEFEFWIRGVAVNPENYFSI